MVRAHWGVLLKPLLLNGLCRASCATRLSAGSPSRADCQIVLRNMLGTCTALERRFDAQPLDAQPLDAIHRHHATPGKEPSAPGFQALLRSDEQDESPRRASPQLRFRFRANPKTGWESGTTPILLCGRRKMGTVPGGFSDWLLHCRCAVVHWRGGAALRSRATSGTADVGAISLGRPRMFRASLSASSKLANILLEPMRSVNPHLVKATNG